MVEQEKTTNKGNYCVKSKRDKIFSDFFIFAPLLFSYVIEKTTKKP